MRLEFAQTQLTKEEKKTILAKTGEKRLNDAIRIAVLAYQGAQ